jgi:serine/threonine protein kinase
MVDGRYARQVLLGRGGFGTVWRARDQLLQRDVAIKEIEFPSILDNAQQAAIRDKVLREARAAARLSHPNAVTVFDVVEDAGRPLIVMELVDAPTLAELVARNGPLEEQRAAALGIEVLDALAAAHAQGIIHRDVKPANVMVTADRHVRLTDFGIASITDDPKLTSSGLVAGSPSYMAPEQAQSEPTSAATDLWGLGATLYFAVEGEGPFDRGAVIPTLTAVVNDEPRPTQRAKLMAPLLADLLSKDSGARPSRDEARRRLTAIGETKRAVSNGDDTTATARLGDPPLRRGPPPARPHPPTVPVEARRPRRGLLLAAGVVVGIAAVVVAALLLSGNSKQDSPSSSVSKAPGANGPSKQGTPAASDAPDTPAGWVSYRDPETGFTIAYPPGWTIRRNGTLTDFRDPDTGAYMRVDFTRTPGPSPADDWYAFEPEFAVKNAGYHRIQITPMTYAGFPAATWEYTYSSPGGNLHAVDLGFVTGRFGFALNYQSPEKDWQRLQPTFDKFKATFRAPA